MGGEKYIDFKLTAGVVGKNFIINYNFSPDFKNALIFPGLPYLPCKKKVAQLLSKIGINSTLFSYQGSWASFGRFFNKEEVREFLSFQGKSFKDMFSLQPIELQSFDYAIGFSFGGLVALYNSKLFKKVVAFAPPLTFREDYEEVERSLLEGGNSFRFESSEKLRKIFEELLREVDEKNFENALIVHGTLDDIVPLKDNEELYSRFNANVFRIKAPHYPSSLLMGLSLDKVKEFLDF